MIESELVSYIKEKPRVKQYSNYVMKKYTDLKLKSSTCEYIFSKTENCATLMVNTLAPVAIKSVEISNTIMRPIVGVIDNSVKMVDHYACEKLKCAEKKVNAVLTCSKKNIHNARLIAEDFFIGKCIHGVCQTSNGALSSVETVLEKMSLIKKRNIDDDKISTTTHNNAYIGLLTQNDCDKTEIEFLKNKQFEARQHLLNIFANPELWKDRIEEYRQLTARINDLHKRIVEDGIMNDIHSHMVHFISFYATSMESLVHSMISFVKLCCDNNYIFTKENITYLKDSIELTTNFILHHAYLLTEKFSIMIRQFYTNSKTNFTTVYQKAEFLLKLYFKFGMTEISEKITNDILPATEDYITYLIPVICSFYFLTINKWNILFSFLNFEIYKMNYNRDDNFRLSEQKNSSIEATTDMASLFSSTPDSSFNDLIDME